MEKTFSRENVDGWPFEAIGLDVVDDDFDAAFADSVDAILGTAGGKKREASRNQHEKDGSSENKSLRFSHLEYSTRSEKIFMPEAK